MRQTRSQAENRRQISTGIKRKRITTEQMPSKRVMKILAKFPFENPNPIMLLTWKGKVLYVNKASLPFLRQWNIIAGSTIPEKLLHEILDISFGNSKGTIEIECERRIYSFRVVCNKEEDLIHLFGYDITIYKKVLNAFKRSENRYRKIVETAGEGIVIVTTAGKFKYINQKFADMLGYLSNEIIGRYSKEFMYDEQDIISTRETRSRLKRGEIVQKEMKFRRKDGSLLWTLYNATPLYDQNSKHTGNLAMHIDITERKKIEEALKKSEQVYRAIGESIDYGIWICDANGKNIYASQSYLDLVGITQEQCSEFGWGDTLHPEDAEKTIAEWKECSKTGGKWDIEHRFRGVDGIYHPILARGIPIRDDNGHILMWAGINLDISSIKQAQEELRKSEEKYRNLVKYAPAVIYEMNLNGTKFISVNDTMCKILGYTREELLSLPPGELLDESGRQYFRDRVRRTLQNKKIESDIEYRIRKKNGEWIDALITIADISNSGENGGSVTIIAYDITERTRRELALKESEERFRELVRRAPAAIYEVDFLKRRFTSVNEAFCKMSGYSREESLKMDILGILTSDSKTIFLNRVKMCIEGEEPEKNIEYEVIKKDGSIINVILNMTFNFNEEGKIVGAMVVGHDITERKKAENNLKDVQAKLNIALENGNIGMFEWDLKTDEVIRDERLGRMLGIKQGSAGKTFRDLESVMNEEDLPHVRKSINLCLEKGLPLETVFRIRSDSGRQKYVSAKAFLNKDQSGNPVSFTGVCIDVTELREGTERLIMNLNEELLRSNKDLENFAYIASHDLQEPLRMVSSYTQLLEKQYKDRLDEKAGEYISYSVEGAKRMYDLLNGLLAYSRINTRGKEFNKVDLNKVVISARKNLSLLIEERKAVIKVSKLPTVNADESQMIVLFQNLISNSIKFSTRPPKIYISSIVDDNNFVIYVKDSGIGIESQYFDRIFKIFQRLLPRDQYDGLGLGLAVCKRIVERHKGKIWVDSIPDKGSTFYFSLPRF